MIITHDNMQLLVPYLRDVLRILDQHEMKVLDAHSKTEAQESSPRDAASEELDENDTSMDGGSIFDNTNSQESSPSTLTISSGNGEALFTTTDFTDILKAVAKRLPTPSFYNLIEPIGLNLDQKDRNGFNRITLHDCPKSGKPHAYSQPRRCVRCETQLCKGCETCLLKYCNFVSDHEAARYPRKSSLAARRIYTLCPCSKCSKEGLIVLRKHRCGCTKTLAGTNHSCETGSSHLCASCFKDALHFLSVPNTVTCKAITVKSDDQIVETKQFTEYKSACEYNSAYGGRIRREHGKYTRVCAICGGTCKPYRLNDIGSPAGALFNGGNEGAPSEWNNGTCRYFLPSKSASQG